MSELEEELELLKREYFGLQEMLAFVLNEVGEPVVVTKEALMAGLPEGTQIAIEEDLQTEVFIFKLERVTDAEQ